MIERSSTPPANRDFDAHGFVASTTQTGRVDYANPNGFNFSVSSLENMTAAEKDSERQRIVVRYWQLEQELATPLTAIVNGDGSRMVKLNEGHGGAQSLLRADAVVLDSKSGGALMVFADCIPCIIVGPGRAALLHCGWRNLVAGIIPTTIQHLGLPSERTKIYLGPHAKQLDFDVDTSGLESDFLKEHKQQIQPIDQGRIRINLSAIALTQLLDRGILPKNITVSSADTQHDPRYYSHRNRYQKANVTGQSNPGGRFAVMLSVGQLETR